MPHPNQTEDRNSTIRFAPAFSAHEQTRQEYRRLGFWASMLSLAIVVLLMTTLVTLGATAPLLLLAIVARLGIVLARMYYRTVYHLP